MKPTIRHHAQAARHAAVLMKLGLRTLADHNTRTHVDPDDLVEALQHQASLLDDATFHLSILPDSVLGVVAPDGDEDTDQRIESELRTILTPSARPNKRKAVRR